MMNSTLFFLVLFATFLSSSIANNTYFNVLHYGAVGDGVVDDTEAFRDAWEATCKSSSATATLHVPGKRFLLSPTNFEGPCKAKQVHVRIDGIITAPTTINKWLCKKCARGGQWINFNAMDGLSIYGSGTIDGQGKNWWKGGQICHKSNACKHKPVQFKVGHSNDVNITNLSFRNSPMKHIEIFKSTKVHISNVRISAPGNSPNTDGLYITHSSNVSVVNSQIGTGDDCISIGPNSAHIYINQIQCGPGHGISIGSLGKHGNHDTVEHVVVSNVDLHGTQNGVRIKTWQGGSGYVRDVLFQSIRSYGSRFPIIIDQNYCDHETCRTQKSAVRISNIRYENIQGTSTKETAVSIVCSETVPCTDIFLTGINLSYTNMHGGITDSVCKNAHGRFSGQVVPAVECLDQA